MPGATPYQAVEAFLVPLERAVACLGTGKVLVSPGGRATTDKTHVWSLNGGDGLVLRGEAAGCRFKASMHYRIVPTDPAKYDIQGALAGHHVGIPVRVPNAGQHQAVGDALASGRQELRHQLYRSWSEDPPPPTADR